MTHIHIVKGWLGAGIVAMLASACGEGGIPDPSTLGGVGNARFAMELPEGSRIERVDYTVAITFLESDPPQTTVSDTFSSVTNGGEAVRILPCHTVSGTGFGLNQVDVTAVITATGLSSAQGNPFTVRATGIFTCRENADTLVNVTLNVIGPGGDGFGDFDFIPIGTFCSAKVDFKPDTYLGVCPNSACGLDTEGIFLFANTCHSVQAASPTYWLCGSPTDWQLNGGSANSFFPIPEHDGRWYFGVTALDGYQMAQADPTLTDAAGNLTVWTGASGSRADLRRVQGQNVVGQTKQIVFEFAAELELAPRVVGQPAPHLLLLVNQEDLGARVGYQTKLGLCDVPTGNVSLYPGLQVLDVRRDGAGSVRLILGNAVPGALAALVVHCDASWDESGAAPVPTVTCGAPAPLIPTTP